MKLIFHLQPRPQERPRFTFVSKKGKLVSITYDPKSSRAYKKIIRELTAKQQPKKFVPIKKTVSMSITFYMQENGRKNAPYTKRPDIDNLIKPVKDALNGLVFKDDSLIYKIRARKVYGNPKIIVKIKEVQDD